jgi:hypothetical protein
MSPNTWPPVGTQRPVPGSRDLQYDNRLGSAPDFQTDPLPDSRPARGGLVATQVPGMSQG